MRRHRIHAASPLPFLIDEDEVQKAIKVQDHLLPDTPIELRIAAMVALPVSSKLAASQMYDDLKSVLQSVPIVNMALIQRMEELVVLASIGAE
eukprot:gene21688-28711_t